MFAEKKMKYWHTLHTKTQSPSFVCNLSSCYRRLIYKCLRQQGPEELKARTVKSRDGKVLLGQSAFTVQGAKTGPKLKDVIRSQICGYL